MAKATQKEALFLEKIEYIDSVIRLLWFKRKPITFARFSFLILKPNANEKKVSWIKVSFR